VFIPAQSGEVLDFLGVTHLLTSQQTGGACYLFESTFDPETGNRLHVHGREDEIAYVLDGALEVRLPAETRSIEAGGIARLPKVSLMRSAIPSRRRRGICSSPFPVASISGSTPWLTQSATVCWTMRCFGSCPMTLTSDGLSRRPGRRQRRRPALR
jgi:hypothetical protein